jgi:hypothetical protein
LAFFLDPSIHGTLVHSNPPPRKSGVLHPIPHGSAG